MNNNISKTLTEVKKSIYGKDQVLLKIMAAIISGGNILMEDRPGCGKTTIALSFSKALNLDYKRVQFTNDLMPSDIIGYKMYDKNTGTMKFVKGPVFTNLLLADEINRTSSKTQSALLQAMEEQKVTINGDEEKLDNPFIVIATQNPFGNAGTNLLPPAQMDRFMISLSVGYPSANDEIEILKSRNGVNPVLNLNSVMDKKDILEIRNQVENVYVDDSIYQYIVSLVSSTRNNPQIDIGSSPRGSLALTKMSKAWAYIHDRDYVIPDDVSDVFVDVMTHRITLKNGELYCISLNRTNILTTILNSVSKPTVRKRR